MKAGIVKLYEGFAKTKAVLACLAVAVYLFLVVFSGGSALEAFWLWLVVAAYIVLPGLFWASLLRVGRIAQGYFGPLALLLGSGFFAVVYCFSMRLGLLWVLQLLPPLLGLAWLALWVARRPRLPARPRPLQPHVWLLVLLCAALVFVYAFKGVVYNGLPSAVGNVLMERDLLWNAGNAASFKLAFPPQDIRFAGVRLHYHYLTELLAGALSLVSGISAYAVVGFYLQPLVLAAMVLCLYRFARLVWPDSLFKAMLFVFSLFLFGDTSLWKVLPNGRSVFWNSHITHLVTNINSVATSVICLCIFFGLFIAAARRKYRVGALHYILIVCAFVMLTFSKGPLAALVTIAVGLAILVGLFLRRSGWRGILLGGVLGGIFALVYTVMFSSGANDSMPLSLSGTLESGWFGNILAHLERLGLGSGAVWVLVCVGFYLLQSLFMLPAAFPLYLVSVGRDLRRFTKLTTERLLFQAMAVGGLLAFFLFKHPHMSQVYFLFGAIFCVNLLAVDSIDILRLKGLGRGFKAWVRKGFTAFVALFAAVGLVTALLLYVHLLGSGLNQIKRNLGIEEKYPYVVVVTPDDEAAALWLKQNTPPDAMFATNRIHDGASRSGISNQYSALAERQAFMEGFQYAKTNMGVSDAEISRRLEINATLFDAATPPGEIARLMEELGISYLVFSTQVYGTEVYIDDSVVELLPAGQFSALELVFASETAYIYRLPEGA